MNTSMPFGKHIFFTGERQVGKSTLLRKIISSHPDWTLGGYFTSWTNKEDVSAAGLYLFPARRNLYLDSADYVSVNNHGGFSVISEEYAGTNSLIARFGISKDDKIIFPDVFDNLGVKLLNNTKEADVILMDEIGFLENHSEMFKSAVLEILGGSTQVIGSLRLPKDKTGSFINAVMSHPNVEVIRITAENRDSLPHRFI